MSRFKSYGNSICGISTAVPVNTVESESYLESFGAKEIHKFSKYSGVKRIHKASPQQTASDLGYVAAEHLIETLEISRADIGILLFVTLSPDYRRPPTSCVLQFRLGLDKECACWDIGQGCSGFVYGHQTMLSLLSGSDRPYGMMILGETTSKLISPNDRSIMLFGDAGSAVLYKKNTEEVNTCILRTNGSGFRDIIVPGGGFRERFPSDKPEKCDDGVLRSRNELRMNGVNIHAFTTSEIPRIIRDYLKNTHTDISDYDRIFLHQANQSILDILSSELKIDEKIAPNCLTNYGNTSSTSIPLMLCNYYGDKTDVREHVLSCGFGVGLSWGITSFFIDSDYVFPITETDSFFCD